MAKLRVDKIAAPIVKDEFTGSVYFDGNGDHIDVPLSSDFNFGAGDFTVEAWVYVHTAKTASIFGTNNSGSNQGYELDVFDDGSVRFYSGNGSAYNFTTLGAQTAAGVVSAQTWTHIVASRQGGTLRLFVNGVLSVSNTSFTHTITDSTIAPDIGNDGRSTGTSYHLHGYISNLRICKGHAVYTGNFTVPTRELPVHTEPPKGVVFPAADNRTVLLACQSSTDATADSSGRHIITAAGDVHAQSANPGLFRKTNITSTITENTGSVYFDGTDDSLNIAANADFAYGTGDFTWEFWFKTDAGFVGGDGGYLIDHAPADSNGNDGSVYVGSNTLKYHSAGVGGVSNLSFGGVSNETWYHVAVARESGTTRLFLNGALVNSASDSANFTTNNTRFRIGDYIGSDYAFKGYISNLRICKGHAVYKSQFIPPTRELEVHQGPDDDRTVLLACYDGENIFADKSGRHIISSIGDRLSSPTPTATDSPIGITTHNPGLTRNVDPTAGPTFQGGAGYTSQNWLTLPKGTTTERMPSFGGDQSGTRGFFAGAYSPSRSDTINYVTVPTLGNAIDFGNLSTANGGVAGFSDSTRGWIVGGNTIPAGRINVMEYVTIASSGNAVDGGDLITATQAKPGSVANSIRGIVAGGSTPGQVKTIVHHTIQTTGIAQYFGDLTEAKNQLAGVMSPTRGVFAGGTTPSGKVDTIEYITIASTGNAVLFGELSLDDRCQMGGASNTVRGLFGGGRNPSDFTHIEYITMATLGNGQDFGDLTQSGMDGDVGAVSNSTRVVFGGGTSDELGYVEIATLGNTTEFGKFTVQTTANQDPGCFSSGHGGLG